MSILQTNFFQFGEVYIVIFASGNGILVLVEESQAEVPYEDLLTQIVTNEEGIITSLWC